MNLPIKTVGVKSTPTTYHERSQAIIQNNRNAGYMTKVSDGKLVKGESDGQSGQRFEMMRTLEANRKTMKSYGGKGWGGP